MEMVKMLFDSLMGKKKEGYFIDYRRYFKPGRPFIENKEEGLGRKCLKIEKEATLPTEELDLSNFRFGSRVKKTTKFKVGGKLRWDI